MRKFKVGDKVRCIRGWEDGGYAMGNIYTVIKEDYEGKMQYLYFLDDDLDKRMIQAADFELYVLLTEPEIIKPKTPVEIKVKLARMV